MRNIASVLLLSLLPLFAAPAASAQSTSGMLDGYVRDQQLQPLPALTAYLVHPTKGRSQPVFTSSTGYFAFRDVPPAPDPYYIELYWGRNLLYRVSVSVDGFVHMPDIILG
jgi:hypothetical protein